MNISQNPEVMRTTDQRSDEAEVTYNSAKYQFQILLKIFEHFGITDISCDEATQFCDFNLIKTKPEKALKVIRFLTEQTGKSFETRCQKFIDMKNDTSLKKIQQKIKMNSIYKPLIRLHRQLLMNFDPENSVRILALTEKYGV